MGCAGLILAILAVTSSGKAAPLVFAACVCCYYWGKEEAK